MTTTAAYIFDIDGTLADGAHRLHHIQKEPKDWTAYFAACPGDGSFAHMQILTSDLASAGKNIVYVSGRSDEVRDETKRWLHEHGFPLGPLYMRKTGDHRDDDILKIEMLEDVRRAGFLPIMAFDDRNRVVAAWRAAGVHCAQVAEGDF